MKISKTPEEAYQESYDEWFEKIRMSYEASGKDFSEEEVSEIAGSLAVGSRKHQEGALGKPRKLAEKRFESMADRARSNSMFKTMTQSDGEVIYRITRELSDTSRAWSILLSKMGYDGVYDDGTASIYYGQEADQLVLFRTRPIQELGTFSSATRPKNKSLEKNLGRVLRAEASSKSKYSLAKLFG